MATQFQPGERTVEHGGRRWTWTGLTEGAGAPCAIGAARIDSDDIEPIINRERHYPPSEVEDALHDAGLQTLAVLGMREVGSQIILSDGVDEDRDYKFVCSARLA